MTGKTIINGPFDHAQASDSLQDEALLQYYITEWDRYTTGANYLNRLFTYLNRHWVKRERDEGRKDVYPVKVVRSLPLHSPTIPSRVHTDHMIFSSHVDVVAVVFDLVER